jgi:hypothetical protein
VKSFNLFVWKNCFEVSYSKSDMSRTVFLFIAFLLLTISATFNQNSIDNGTKKSFKYALFYFPTEVYIPFEKNYKPNKLTQKQLAKVKSIIRKLADSLNLSVTSTDTKTGKVDPLEYVFQIVSAKAKKDQSILWVNAICDPPKDWHKALVFIMDEGSYTFKINLNKSKYFNLDIDTGSG